MNEFLQQFVIESREIIDQASDGLLALEQSPDDAERLDAVFRAFHTLKGSAGIVEFPAMERLMHAAEDVLSEARKGQHSLTPERVGHCLTCLDRVVQWLDHVEQTGELPLDPDAKVDEIINRFVEVGQLTPPGKDEGGGWTTSLLGRHPNQFAAAITAIRYTPDAECFYQGEDPVARVTSVPHLLALELDPATPWSPLDTFDTFNCNLVLTALTAASVSDVTAHMKGHSGECEIVAATPGMSAGEVGTLQKNAREILEEQLTLLSRSNPQKVINHLGSAGLTAANVLRSLRRNDDAEMLARASERSLEERTAQPLRDAIAKILGAGASGVVHAPAPTHPAEAAARTLRVDSERIDALVRLAGELTVAKNAIGHTVNVARGGRDSVAELLKNNHEVLEHLVGELQRAVLAIRVLPVRSVFLRFPRVLREMSASLGKPTKLELEGADTEADKAIVEMLFEPLLHVVRNAIGHGIESPGIRLERGKPPVATIRIRAARQADQVVIEVSDDGSGIDVERVRAVARRRGVVSDEILSTMTETDVINLVFAAGFSTAEKVSQLSGRGIGMDAVRQAVERVGGGVTLESRTGIGTTVRVSLPFSVMMTRVVTVEAGGQLFGIPLDAVVETVSVPKEFIRAVGAAYAIVLRNRAIPVYDLANMLGVSRETPDRPEALILVVTVAGQSGAIRVDRLGDRMEVILQPLGGLLAGTPGITGTTLLGDGRVLLVLDVAEVLQ